MTNAPKVELIPLDDLTPYSGNAKTHPAAQIDEIKASIREFGFTVPILADLEDAGLIAAGHGRLIALRELFDAEEDVRLVNGETLPPGLAPVVDCSRWTPDQRRAYTLADNKLTENGEWNEEILRIELDALFAAEPALRDITGFSPDEIAALNGALNASGDSGRISLMEQFGLAPFSVLNARDGWWQDRKRAWISLGIKSELGRGEDGKSARGNGGLADQVAAADARREGVLLKAQQVADPSFYIKKRAAEAALGRELTKEEFLANHYTPPDTAISSGTSIFDPVLCEVAYRWFSPPDGVVFDPFAGGSVRGVVAGWLGREYVGIDLREEQIDANVEQWAAITAGDEEDRPDPLWHAGDSATMDTILDDEFEADFIFSCPPYADLEVYSDDPADLSNMGYDDFVAAYRVIIAKACERLRDDRFACFVVGEIRDKRGAYYGFVNDTIDAFRDAGLDFYNEAILVTSLGSLPVRVRRQFEASRKIGKTHQNVLVFVKGDAWRAVAAIGAVEFGGIEIEGEAPPENDDRLFDDPKGLTPIDYLDGVWAKRDDLFGVAGVRGGKVRSCWYLAQGATGLCTAGSRASPQVNIVAHVAAELGIPCRAHTPQGTLSPEVQAAADAGAEIIQHKAGYNNVIIARSRDDAAERGWRDIPFGMECIEAVEATAGQVADIPEGVERIVMPVGSGMSLAGVLTGLVRAGLDIPVLGVVVGADPEKRLDDYAPPDWRDRVELVPSGIDYHADAPVTVFQGVRLDPIYKAKCIPFLLEGDMLWIVGIRATA